MGHVVTSQIRIAGSVSVLAAIGKKGLSLEALSYILMTDCFDRSVQEDDRSASSFRTPTSKPMSAAAIPNQVYVCSNWTSSIVHGIRDERSVRVQPRNEGIIVCAFL